MTVKSLPSRTGLIPRATIAKTLAPFMKQLRVTAFSGNEPFALTRWFAVVGAFSIGVFSVAMGWLLTSFLATRMLERDASISREFVQSIANIQQIGGWFRAPDVPLTPSAAEFFVHVAAMPDVLRANVYARDRRVLWSSRTELIGRVFPANHELEQALSGKVVVNVDDHHEHDATGKAEHMGLQGTQHGYVENYLPVFDEKSRELIAVIELYRQPKALLAAIADGQRRVWIGAAIGALALFAVLLTFVRRTERALRDQQRRLIDAETLAAMGELSAAVAHSIRNPLGSIRSTAELQRELPGSDAESAGEIVRNVDRIEHLVRTLLSYANDPIDRLQQANLDAVLRDVAGRFEQELRARGRIFAMDLPPRLGTVAADPVLLAQVFNSLLANAAEATPDGGSVALSARAMGSRVEVLVVDSGHGMDASQLTSIFKPFYTTKPRGLGLGLPLARRIVERLGGQIVVNSAPGAGTQVRVSLPTAEH